MKKLAVITGASSGIGSALAHLFLEKGYVLILNARSESSFEDFKNHSDVDIILGDLTDSVTIQKIADKVSQNKNPLSVLINNAGITYIQPFEKNTKEELDKILDTNLKAPILLTQKLYPIMTKQGSGTIVFINSTAGKEGKLNHTMYSASKFGLKGFADSLRLEAKQNGIRVLSIHPGGVNTNLYRSLEKKPDLASFMDPKKVAEVIVHLVETEGISPDEIVINRISK